MRIITIMTAIILASGVAGTAQAGSFGKPCTTTAESEWLKLSALEAKVVEQGYTVQKGKIKNACGEFYARDKAGQKIELFIDPATGAIVGKD